MKCVQRTIILLINFDISVNLLHKVIDSPYSNRPAHQKQRNTKQEPEQKQTQSSVTVYNTCAGCKMTIKFIISIPYVHVAKVKRDLQKSSHLCLVHEIENGI